MKTQREYMKFIKEKFAEHIENNHDAFNSYCYNDKRAVTCIKNFKDSLKVSGLNLSNCYHANGIGNNNEYTIFIEDKDSEGFVIQKNIAKLYYCYGIYGGCHVSLSDLATKEKTEVGHAR